MLKAYIVDDEQPALMQMKELLAEIGDIAVAGLFSCPQQALEQFSKQQPDVIFLDIDMPRLQGLELAAKLRDINPRTSIVFVTAYSEFALESYDVFPLDYLLKPVDKHRLKQTVQELATRQQWARAEEDRQGSYFIRCFGALKITKSFWNDNCEPQVEHLSIANRKVKELLCYLIANFERDVTRDELLDVLFDGVKTEKSINHLHVTAYSLRKMLEDFGFQQVKVDRYNITIAPGGCDFVDFVRFVRSNNVIDTENAEEAMEIVRKHPGPFLAGEDYPWSVESREWVEELLESLSLKLVEHYETANAIHNAEQILLTMLDRNPFCEQAQHMLLDLYITNNMNSKYIRHYRKYKDMMAQELGLEPEEEYAEFYRTITEDYDQ